jgi:Transposase DDE domain
MATFASSTSGPAGKARPGELVEGEPGLGERTRQKGGEAVGPKPTDRGKPGSKHHLLTDRNGVVFTAANVHDSKVFEELVDAVGPIKRPGRGRPHKRPEKLHADKAYDFPRCRRALRRRGIKSRRKERKRCQRATGAAPVGSGAYAGVARAVSQALGALREASGYP